MLEVLLQELKAQLLNEKTFPQGTIRQWRSGKVQKQSDGSWKPLPSTHLALGHRPGMSPFRMPPVSKPHPLVEKILKMPLVQRLFPSEHDGVKMVNRTLLDRSEKAIESLDREEAHIFDLKGGVRHRIQGDQNSVLIPDVPMDNLVFTHNHPQGLSLSMDDVNLAIFKNLGEMRAVSREHDGLYVHRLIRPESGWPSMDVVESLQRGSERHQLRMRLLEKLSSQIDHLLPNRNTGERGVMTFREADRKYTEELLAAHAFVLGIPYVKERIGD